MTIKCFFNMEHWTKNYLKKQIVLQGSFDDPEKPGNEDTGDCDNMRCIDSKSDVRSPQMQDRKCELISKKSPSAHEIVLEGDGILPCPPERLIPYSKMRQLSPHDESYDRSFAGRYRYHYSILYKSYHIFMPIVFLFVEKNRWFHVTIFSHFKSHMEFAYFLCKINSLQNEDI